MHVKYSLVNPKKHKNYRIWINPHVKWKLAWTKVMPCMIHNIK